MKKILFSLVAILAYFNLSAQIVNIPDANFKAKLLEPFTGQDLSGNYILIDSNNDSEIQVTEALQIGYLDVGNSSITSLVGISSFTNLQTLICGGNSFTTLDLSYALTNLTALYLYSDDNLEVLNVNGLTNLENIALYGGPNSQLQELHCSGTRLTLLNLDFPNLTILECANVPLKSLDFAKVPNLEIVDCAGNQFQTLDLNSLSKLKNLNCSNNQLKFLLINNGAIEGILNLSENPGLAFVCADASQVTNVLSLVNSYGYTDCAVGTDCSPSSLDFVVVPDAGFYARLLEADASNQIAKNLKGAFFKIDSNNDSLIQFSEAKQVSYLDVNFYVTSNSYAIHSLEGVSSFTKLEILNCSGTGNSIPTLDLSGMSKLKYLNCAANGIFTINVDGLSHLEEFHCSLNNFTTLDLSASKKLKIFTCTGVGALEKLDLSQLTKLQELNCSSNGSLQELKFTGNRLATLTFGDLPNLITLECPDSKLTTLNLNEFTKLQNLNCSGNQLQSLDVNNLTNLQILNCSNNHLESLYIKNGVVEATLNLAKNSNLSYVCADPDQISNVENLAPANCVVDSNCYYNVPVDNIENTFATASSKKHDFLFSNYLSLYPNPVKEALNINKTGIIELNSIHIYDVLGQMVLEIPKAQNTSGIDVSHLGTGIYLITINSDKGISNTKFLKE